MWLHYRGKSSKIKLLSNAGEQLRAGGKSHNLKVMFSLVPITPILTFNQPKFLADGISEVIAICHKLIHDSRKDKE